jgi:hypothetical protein
VNTALKLAVMIQQQVRETQIIEFPEGGDNYTFIRIDPTDDLEQVISMGFSQLTRTTHGTQLINNGLRDQVPS